MATDANIKQDNSRSSSTIFLCLQEIRGSCPCRGFTFTQASARTTHHSSISANFKTIWGKRDQFAASSIFFLINLYFLGKRGRRGLEHAPQSSGSGWQDLSGNPEWEGHAPQRTKPGYISLHHWHQLALLPQYIAFSATGMQIIKKQKTNKQKPTRPVSNYICWSTTTLPNN